MTVPGKQLTNFTAASPITDGDQFYVAQGGTGVGIERAAPASAVGSYVLKPIAGASSPDAGSLTGAENIVATRGTGLLQTTLTKIAAWMIQTFNGFTQAGTGALARPVQDKLRDTVSIKDFGIVNDGVTDNTAAMAALAALLATFTNTATVPRVVIPSGIYAYATSPNWAIQGLTLIAENGAIFKHTGSGPAFNVDGGATGGGVFRMRVEGGLRIQGNANSTYGLYNRAIHQSLFDVTVRDVANAALQTAWCVSNEYRIGITPIGDPAFNVTPTNGIVLDKRGTGEMTSDCTFYNPVVEGLPAGYGINLQNAVQNTFIGGTSESNGGGLFVSGTSMWNRFINLDLEFNTSADITCQGLYNVFDNCLSTTTSTFAGTSNLILTGNYNSIISSGIDNEFFKVRYASNAGTFNDGAGTGTIKRSVRNLTTGLLDPDLDRNPHQLLYINGPTSNNTVIGSADQLVSGGSANDVLFYHFGSGQTQFWSAGVKNLSLAPNQIGFYGTTPIGKPTVTGAKGGNAALASLLTQLASLGLITDSSTA